MQILAAIKDYITFIGLKCQDVSGGIGLQTVLCIKLKKVNLESASIRMGRCVSQSCQRGFWGCHCSSTTHPWR